jgi:hypothetical protein
MDQADTQLAGLCVQTAIAAEEAAAWVDRNKVGVGAKSSALRRELRRRAELARKYERAAKRPLCIGIFGPSQVGKSYLVSTLARKGNNPLIAVLDREYHFIKEIGPEKNVEATGLVTRFSIHSTGAPASHPVAVRLLSQIDLVKILANTYFLDFKPTEERVPSLEEIGLALNEAQSRMQDKPVDNLRDVDIDDLRRYCAERFAARRTIENLESGYWTQLEELAPRLLIGDRAKLFSFLWGGLPELTTLYTQLYLALQGLDFAEEANCPIEALVPRDQSILDVDTLKEITDPKGPPIEVIGRENKRRHNIPRAYLTAIVAELLIQISEQPRDYSQFTDILDFPGARSRKQYEDPEKFVQRHGAIFDLFLRGKVAYLFDRYCDERELTGMLLCMQPGNQEVQTLPDMVLTWIHQSHGSTPAERAKVNTALFFVFTKFDRRFEVAEGTEDRSPEEIEEVWTAAIKSALTEFYGKGKDAWPREWHPNAFFDNCFWLRSPSYKAYHLLDYDKEGKEVDLRDAQRVAKYKRGYLSSKLVTHHFRDPEKAWQAAFNFNDGGATYLADALSPVCKPELKRNQIKARLDELRRDLKEQLKEFQVSDDRDAEERKRVAAAEKARDGLQDVIMGQRFGHLLSEFQVGSDDLQFLFKRTKLAGEKAAGGPKVTDGTAISWAQLRNRMGLTTSGKSVNESAPAPRDRYIDLAAAAIEHWADRLQALPRQSQFLKFLRVEPETIETVVRELLAGSERINLRNEIAREMRATNPAIDEFLKPAMASGERINRYVWKLGQDALELSARAKVTNADGEWEPVFKGREAIESIDSLPEDGEAYYLSFIAEWLQSFVDLARINSRGDLKQKFSLEESDRLNGIMDRLGA